MAMEECHQFVGEGRGVRKTAIRNVFLLQGHGHTLSQPPIHFTFAATAQATGGNTLQDLPPSFRFNAQGMISHDTQERHLLEGNGTAFPPAPYQPFTFTLNTAPEVLRIPSDIPVQTNNTECPAAVQTSTPSLLNSASNLTSGTNLTYGTNRTSGTNLTSGSNFGSDGNLATVYKDARTEISMTKPEAPQKIRVRSASTGSSRSKKRDKGRYRRRLASEGDRKPSSSASLISPASKMSVKDWLSRGFSDAIPAASDNSFLFRTPLSVGAVGTREGVWPETEESEESEGLEEWSAVLSSDLAAVTGMRVSGEAGVALATALEFLCVDLVEGAGKVMKERGGSVLGAPDIVALAWDEPVYYRFLRHIITLN